MEESEIEREFEERLEMTPYNKLKIHNNNLKCRSKWELKDLFKIHCNMK